MNGSVTGRFARNNAKRSDYAFYTVSVGDDVVTKRMPRVPRRKCYKKLIGILYEDLTDVAVSSSYLRLEGYIVVK